MANNKSPKNDFAPAWLKIPEGESSKTNGSRSGDYNEGKSGRPMRRDDHFNYNRFPPPDYPYQPLQRQRSFDNYYEDRRYNGPKFRHHSVDDDFYNGPPYGAFPPPYYNGYDFDKYGGGFRSHPSLYRDGKYQHPNARFGHAPVGGGFPPYYDPYFEYYGDGYYNGYMGRPPGKRYPGDRERHPSKGDRLDKDKSAPKNLGAEEEFPSLNGDVDPAEKSKVQNTTGVWEKPPRSKPLSNGNANTSDGKNADAKGSNNMYKALVPQKGSFKKGSQGTLSGSPIKAVKMNGSISDHSSSANNTLKSPSAPVEILSAQVRTKRLGDKKSNFLRQMKGPADPDPNCNDVNKLDVHKQDGEDLCNGMDGLSVSPKESALSSSLEAEQRLLKEMGWNETDDDDYVITEDDLKEFQNLTKQLKERKNGMTKVLPKTFSPTHVPTFNANENELNDTLSSTSDDDSDKE